AAAAASPTGHRGPTARIHTDPARRAAAALGRAPPGGSMSGEAKELRALADRIEAVARNSNMQASVWEQVRALRDYLTLRGRVIELTAEREDLKRWPSATISRPCSDLSPSATAPASHAEPWRTQR